MEREKRKSEVKDAVPGGSQKRAREEEETTVTEEEVEEFFAILKRIQVAVDYFKKGNGDLRDLTDLQKMESLNSGWSAGENGGEKKTENIEGNVGLDLNADPVTSSDPV